MNAARRPVTVATLAGAGSMCATICAMAQPYELFLQECVARYGARDQAQVERCAQDKSLLDEKRKWAENPEFHRNARSIVGTWASGSEGCKDPMDRVVIQPMQLAGPNFRCDFSKVAREGAVVTWTGRCADDDSPRPTQTTVVAKEAEGVLTLRYIEGGRQVNSVGDLVRCPR